MIRISHQGMFNNGGTPFALAAALVIPVAQQATFAHYGKLAKRTSNQGECDLAGAGDIVVGVFVDVSPKGDTCTVETEGYEWVNADLTGVTVGGLVTAGAGGILQGIAGAKPTLDEMVSGVFQVDAIDSTLNKVLVEICCRL